MENEKKKTGYQSTWQDQLKDTANKIINREKFSYDLNGDALYKQYKDRYIQQGKQAMMDTMGQAQAMTGGYGNSYAQTVGQQTYQGYLQGLNDQVPQLYQIALDKYTREGADMRDNMNMMMQQDNIDYGRYRDQLADQDAAYNKLMALMTGYGYKPTPEEMAAAGMTEAQYRAIMGLPDPSAGSSGGGGGKVGGKGAYVIPNAGNTGDGWGDGIDETRNTSGLKASAWDYTKNNLTQLVNSGNSAAAVKYMDQLTATGQMSEGQYKEAIKILEKKK
jgi:hypothetical protein